MQRSHEKPYSSSVNSARFQHENTTAPPPSNNVIPELEFQSESLPRPGAGARKVAIPPINHQKARTNGGRLSPRSQSSDDYAALAYIKAIGSGSNEPERQISPAQVKRVLIKKLTAEQKGPFFTIKPVLDDAPQLINGIMALPTTCMSRRAKCSTIEFVATMLAAFYGTMLPNDKITLQKDGQSFRLTIPQLHEMAAEMATSTASEAELLEKSSKTALQDSAKTTTDFCMYELFEPVPIHESEQNMNARWQVRNLTRALPRFDSDAFADDEHDAAAIILKRFALEEMGWKISSSDVSKPMFEKQANSFFAKNAADPITVYYKQMTALFPEAEPWFRDPCFLMLLANELEPAAETGATEATATEALSGPAGKFLRLVETGKLAAETQRIDEELEGRYSGEQAVKAFANEVRNQLPVLQQMTTGKLNGAEIEEVFAGLTTLNEKTTMLWKALQKQTDLLRPGWKCVPTDQIDGRFSNVSAPLGTAIDNPIKNEFSKLHANRIDFGNDLKAIASQKPKEAYLDAFWLSSFKEDVALIADLTNAKDNGGDQDLTTPYVPSEGAPMIFDSVSIELMSSEEKNNGPLQTLTVTDSETGKKKQIQRLCFNQWPDYGVISVINLVRLGLTIEHLMHNLNQPLACSATTNHNHVNNSILVHCRAGVGRTGTVLSFMAANRKLLLTTKTDSTITLEKFSEAIAEVVMRGRQDRAATPGASFVQTAGQFQLLINSLLLSHASRLS